MHLKDCWGVANNVDHERGAWSGSTHFAHACLYKACLYKDLGEMLYLGLLDTSARYVPTLRVKYIHEHRISKTVGEFLIKRSATCAPNTQRSLPTKNLHIGCCQGTIKIHVRVHLCWENTVYNFIRGPLMRPDCPNVAGLAPTLRKQAYQNKLEIFITINENI